MLNFWTCGGLYIFGIISVYLWDALVGFGIEFDGQAQPPLALVAVLWPITFVVGVLYGIHASFKSLKSRRIERQKVKKKMRVELEETRKIALMEVEEALKEVDSDKVKYRSL